MTTNGNTRAVWFDVPCTDLDRAIRFYGAVLSCEVAREEFDGGAMGVLAHDSSGVGGCLVVTTDNTPSDKGILLYLNCDGRLDDAIARATEHGGAVLTPKHQIGPHGFRAILRDSEGNRVALHSNTA